jgi:hypothetical protein
MMVITHENYLRWALRYWLAEPVIEPCPPGYVCIDMARPAFPDLMKDLTPRQRKKFIPVLRRHPEYLQYEIGCSHEPQ